MATQTNPKETLRPPITVLQWGESDGSPRYDLVDGELEMRPEEPFWHALLLMEIARIVFNHVHEHHLVGKNLFKGIPPLVVEILSPSNEDVDRHDKAREYAGLGVGQYWIIDFPARRLEVHALREHADGERDYELIEVAEGDAVFRPALFPGLEIPLGEVWPAEFEHRTDD
jgi:hypothetical protein